MKKRFLILLILVSVISFSLIGLFACYCGEDDGRLIFVEYGDGYEVKEYIINCHFKNITVEIPTTYNNKPVLSIGNRAFDSCINVVAVTLPNSITNIGAYAFCNCSSLTSITIPNSVTNIGEGAFIYCSSLTNIIIPDSVKNIGEASFYDSDDLESVMIGSGVTNIGSIAFGDCDRLESITVDEYNQYYKSIDGNLYNKDATTLIQYAIGKKDTSFNMPTSVMNIRERSFAHCVNLISIILSNNVTSVGEYAFYKCTSLQYNVEGNLKYLGNDINKYLYLVGTISNDITSATINNDCVFIGDDAFDDCIKITEILIPNSVTSIGARVFSNCGNLSEIIIGSSVMSINKWAFSECDDLTNVVFEDTTTWYLTISKTDFNNKTNGYHIDVTSPAVNAKTLKEHYKFYYYKK